MSRILTLIGGALCVMATLASCGSGGTGKPKAGTKSGSPSASAPSVRQFPSGPAVPSVVSDPGQALDWAVTHFWDNFLDPARTYHCDSTIVNGVGKGELDNAVLAYVRLLGQGGLESAQKAISNLFDKAAAFETASPESNVFEYLATTISGFLYDPNSMFRNEDLYLPFVKKLSVSELVGEDERETYARAAQMCSLNRIGTPATDFKFTLTSGKRMRLHGIKADWTVLLFSNPGCKACESIYKAFTEAPSVLSLVKSGKVAVANIYIDEELDKWLGHCASYPAEWYNGYDQDYVIRKDLLYSVRAIPSLYVLDSQKRVVLKDAPLEAVLPFLGNIQQ